MLCPSLYLPQRGRHPALLRAEFCLNTGNGASFPPDHVSASHCGAEGSAQGRRGEAALRDPESAKPQSSPRNAGLERRDFFSSSSCAPHRPALLKDQGCEGKRFSLARCDVWAAGKVYTHAKEEGARADRQMILTQNNPGSEPVHRRRRFHNVMS